MKNQRKTYVAPRVKSIRFFVEAGYQCSIPGDCEDREMRMQLENYRADYDTENLFGDYSFSEPASES